MEDLEAMRLFVAAGNKAVQWHAIDEIERSHYRKMALEKAEPAAVPFGVAAGPKMAPQKVPGAPAQSAPR